jgi:general secretion pathway protein J
MTQAKTRGFTLIEVLVALVGLALMAGLSWRGLDSMVRARDASQQRIDEVAVVQTALAQWRTDLDAATHLPGMTGTQGIDWDGRVLRIVRRSTLPQADGSDAGLWVVGWTLRNDSAPQWVRWQSPPVRDRASLLQAWQDAAQWGQNAGTALRAQETTLFALTRWQLFYFRSDSWSNPLSSTGAPAGASTDAIPDGIRLLLTLPPTAPIRGEITLDWVRPTFSAPRS